MAGVVASLVAAVLWYYASAIVVVHDNLKTVIGELQRIGRWQARAAVAASIAAACAAYIFARELRLF